VDQLAESLSRGLGWYCNFHSDVEVVVFYGRVFRYTKGDRTIVPRWRRARDPLV
jgi:hypothetical protein